MEIMNKGFLLLLMLFVAGQAQTLTSLQKLQQRIQKLSKENNDMQTNLNDISERLTGELEKCTVAPAVEEPVQDNNKEIENRLTALEERITAIKNFLTDGKKLDAKLRSKSGEVIKEMQGKLTEVDQTKEQLKTDVANRLDTFEIEIKEVDKIANVIVSSDGTVMYGHVGSACTEFGQECIDDQSECRSGRCQCLPGLSYNLDQRKCVSDCGNYGNTYQVVSKWIIRGHNNLHLNSTNLAECKVACENTMTFQCRSLDYFSQWKECFLSEKVVPEVPEDVWEYNSEGIHLQRDCA